MSDSMNHKVTRLYKACFEVTEREKKVIMMSIVIYRIVNKFLLCRKDIN